MSRLGKNQYSEVTTESVIERFKKVHGDTYDYSKVNYVSMHTKVTIICKKHGEFQQIPSNHLKGQGCYFCGRERSENTRRKTREQFIEEAKVIHGDKYDYSKVEYKNNKEKVCIICPIHGEFWQRPYEHLKFGCKQCSVEYTASLNIKRSAETFEERARKIHNNKYTYDPNTYKGVMKYITAYCPIHGEFKQRAHEHLSGCGCPKCNSSKMELLIENNLKQNDIEYIPQYRNKEIFGLKSIDFYIQDKKIAIECQGDQHFIPVSFSGNGDKNNNLESIQNNDKNKYQECMDNGIELIYFINKQTGLSKKDILKKHNPNNIYSEENLFDNQESLIRYVQEKITR